jgi:hypothetical protein
MSLRCLLGFHDERRPCGFVRLCLRCGRIWESDYFQWRGDGFPRWHRVRLAEMDSHRRGKVVELLRDYGLSPEGF